MYYNGNNKYDVHRFLGEVHSQLRDRYTQEKTLNKEEKKAKIMTNFLQKFKDFYTKGEIDDADKDFFNAIKPILESSLKENFKDFFGQYKQNGQVLGQQTGTMFEQGIGSFLSILKTGDAQSAGQITQGENLVTQKDVDKFLQEYYIIDDQKDIQPVISNIEQKISKNTLKAVAPKTQKLIDKQKAKNNSDSQKYQLAFKDIFQKVDIDARTIIITIQWQVTPENQKAINYLTSSTFTAKSYRAYKDIEIGSTNSIRAYFSVLDALKYEYKTKASSYLHALALVTTADQNINNRKARGEDTALYVYKMRFIYELTGIGQVAVVNGKFKELAEADYLLYNESNKGRIFVFPTKSIINELFNKIENYVNIPRRNRGNVFESNNIYMKKSWLTTISNKYK